MQNEKSGKLDKFFAGKGFYIVLALCVIVIGISAYSLVKGADDTGVGLDPGISAARQTERPEPSAEPPVSTEKPQPVDAPSEDDVVSAGTLTQDDVWPEQVTWRWPVSGEIERGYSVEALSYDVTMADWRTHDGVDILAQQGEVVVAAGDGEVVSVTQDDLYGTTVVIDHGSGIKTQYSNLADTPTVSPGDKVKGGDVIGSVGKTAICEIGQGSHMHFAMSRDGASVDPTTYIPILKFEEKQKNMLTIRAMSSIIPIARLRNGGIAQLARACGSYPQCPRFESRCRYQKRRRYFYLRLNFGPLVKRLRHRPFTAVTWVRFPYGSPKRNSSPLGGLFRFA